MYRTTLNLCLLALLLQLIPHINAQTGNSERVIVTISPKPVNVFLPDEALGAGVDGMEKGDVNAVYTPENIRRMRSAGLRRLTYRLRTELNIAAWHWNPSGIWSDQRHKQGYWISSDTMSGSVPFSNGYDLPRRGSTIDQANNKGYSRLNDGDLKTYWKSNPYLDSYYTKEPEIAHAQWIIVNFVKPVPIDTVRIVWGNPYAVDYQVEYWVGQEPELINDGTPGIWRLFPKGKVTRGQGGTVRLRLAGQSITSSHFRILLTKPGSTGLMQVKDIRDRLGYAVREVYLGTTDGKGRFHDRMRHGRTEDTQTITAVSSTDPWHRAIDRNQNIEQPGLDRVLKSGLTNGLPMLTPVPLVYDTPQNAAALIRFLIHRHYPVNQIEMGEEPDGQGMTPEDYAALYCQFASVIHHEDPKLLLGGPGFQTNIKGWRTWPDAEGKTSWMGRFLAALKRSNHLNDLNFFSFEWYPFDNVCGSPAGQLVGHPTMLEEIYKQLVADGVPTNIPWIITEYGYSAFAGKVEMDVPAALLNAEVIAQFLTLGGSTAYLYGYEPNQPIQEWPDCVSFGNLTLFLADDRRRIKSYLPSYYGAKIMATEWAQPGNGEHELYKAVSNTKDASKRPLITAYAVKRPDGQWALLLLNKDERQAHSVSIQFTETASGKIFLLSGPVRMIQYSPAQFQLIAAGEDSHPSRNLPPVTRLLNLSREKSITLPPFSLTVLRGNIVVGQ